MIGFMGVFAGAILIILIVSLILRKLLTKLFKLNNKIASSIACLLPVIFCTAAAFPQMGDMALVIYPAGGLIVWIFLFYNSPIIKRRKPYKPKSKEEIYAEEYVQKTLGCPKKAFLTKMFDMPSFDETKWLKRVGLILMSLVSIWVLIKIIQIIHQAFFYHSRSYY